jgi:PKD repeat protein
MKNSKNQLKMKHLNYLFCSMILFSFFIISCEKEEAKPVANFTMNKTKAETGETITFTNSSENAITYSWAFGDGNTSTDENPTHSYSSDGTFTITLTAKGVGGENSTSKTITVKTSYDGSWKASTTESDANLTSASAKFTVNGTSVSISNWSATTSFGYFFGMSWSATLGSDNTFTFTPEIGSFKPKYTIKLKSSTSGTGTFNYQGKDYAMTVSKQ